MPQTSVLTTSPTAPFQNTSIFYQGNPFLTSVISHFSCFFESFPCTSEKTVYNSEWFWGFEKYEDGG